MIMKIHFLLLLWRSVATVAINNSPSAFIEIILYEPDQKSGRYLTKTSNVHGFFSTVGSSAPAEGNIKMMHPLGLCLNSIGDFPNYPYGWVGVIKLEPPQYGPEACRHVITKAKRAIEKGATAVIFDITNHPEAFEQLNSITPNLLNRPVIVVEDDEAIKLMKLLHEEVEITEEARARIERSVAQESSNNHMFDVGLFIVCFTMVFILGIIIIAKFKCFRKRREISLNNISKSALGQMKTRKYRKQRIKTTKRKQEVEDNCSKSIASSGGAMCAICLEEFNYGQELRVVPCGHEFHRKCIDKWLNEKWTCPLCNMNVLEHLSLDYVGVEASNNNNEDRITTTRNSRQATVDNVSMFQLEPDPTSQANSTHSHHNVFPTQLITASELTNHRNLAQCVFGHQRAVNNTYVVTPAEQQSSRHDSNSSQAYSHNHRYSVLTEKTLSSCQAIYGSNPSVENFSSEAEGILSSMEVPLQGTYKILSTSRYHKNNILLNSSNHCANFNTTHQYLQSACATTQSNKCAPTQKRGHHKHTNNTTSCASNIANESKTKPTHCRRHRNKFVHSKTHDNILFNKPNEVGLWQSGYSPDSSDIGESNFSISYVRRKRNDGNLKHKDSVANMNFNPTYEPPVVLSDSSIQCHYGSSTIYNPQNQPKLMYPMWLANNIKVTDRPTTPCIGYSSSDDAENMIRFSNSSLEGVLG